MPESPVHPDHDSARAAPGIASADRAERSEGAAAPSSDPSGRSDNVHPRPPPTIPTWHVTRREPSLSPAAAAVLMSMRSEVRATNAYRARILEGHPAPVLDDTPHPDAADKAARAEARIAALEETRPADGAAQATYTQTQGPLTAVSNPAADSVDVGPDVLHRMATSIYSQSHEAYEAREAVRERVRMIASGAEPVIMARMALQDATSREDAGKRAVAALGERGFSQERTRIADLAAAAWEAGVRLDRLANRAAELLHMRQHPGLARGGHTDAHEVLREVERRRAELYRASLEARAEALDRRVLPQAEPRLQEKRSPRPGESSSPPQYSDLRSIDCLRCGTSHGREDGRSRLYPDGTPKIDAEGRPERAGPRDGELCTPCWLNGAPMSVAELILAQRQARLLEDTQVHYRPGQAGWNKRAAESMDVDQARRGITPLLDERLDAPSPWIVQPTPSELADRRMEDRLEHEAQLEELQERAQWDMPTDRESEWWEVKFAGMFEGERDTPSTASTEERLQLETARLAEAQRRLLAVVGVEDPALRRVLETRAAVRLHLAVGSAVRESWEQTRGIERAEARAVARDEVQRRFLAPEASTHQQRLREARGLALPRSMPPELQAAIRARQIDRILADLDLPTLVRRLDGIVRDAPADLTPAVERLRQRLEAVLGEKSEHADRRLQGAVAAPQLAESALQNRAVHHSGVDEAVLPGERRAEAHERRIDRWLEQIEGAPGTGAVRSARDLAREAGELNPRRRDVKEHTPADGARPWQVTERDTRIAEEVRILTHTSPDRIRTALEEYRSEVLARGVDVGDPFSNELRDQFIEAAARQSGFTQAEIDQLREVRFLTAAAADPGAYDRMLREAGAWMADPERNNDPARLRDALELRTAGGTRLVFSDEDVALVARAQRAAVPYTTLIDEYRNEWVTHHVSAAREADRQALVEAAPHPAVREAIAAHTDPRVAELAGQVAAMREHQKIDAPYQEAKARIDHAETVLDATAKTREAAHRAWGELQGTIKAQFTQPERLLERIREMEPGEVRQLAERLRTNPLALSGNHPRAHPKLRIPGVTAAGPIESFEPQLKTVRAPGLRGLIGQTSAGGVEHQARIAAVALETWAEVRARGERTRTWAAEELGTETGMPLARVHDAAQRRLAALKTEHAELVRAWEQLSPAPTPAQIDNRLKALDPATAALARESIPDLTSAPRPLSTAEPRREPAPTHSRALSR